MIRKNQGLLSVLSAVAEGLILFASYLLATYIRFDIMYGNYPELYNAWNASYFEAAGLFAVIMVLVYHARGLYKPQRASGVWNEIARQLQANVLGVLLFAAFLYITRITDFSRLAMAIFFVIVEVLLIAKRVATRSIERHYRRLGYNQKHVVVVGNGHLAHKYMQNLRENPELGYTVDGYISREQRPELGKCLGSYEELEQILADPGIDEVIVALEPHEAAFMPMIVGASEKQGTKISMIPFFSDYIPSQPTVEVIGDSKIFNLRTIPLDKPTNAFLKRATDVAGSLALILLTSPIMLLTAIGVKLSSPGPVLFRQQRVGKNKKLFTMYKFRSMRLNDEEDKAWSRDRDDRKTRFGSFIRKTSIDEFPQFFNVLKGDMSLVGPRPEIPFYVEQFREEVPLYMVKHQVRPGITGWAQVNGYRGDTSIPERIKRDIWYIENWTYGLDIKILLLTAFGGMINKEKLS